MRCVMAVVALAAFGCGGGGNEAPPVQCPAPQAPVGTLSGTLGGSAFAPAEMGALLLGPSTCRVGATNVNVAAVIVGLSSFQGLCTQLQAHGFCWDKANATMASLQIANGGLFTTPAVPGPGTYPVTIGTPTIDLGGNFQITGGSYGTTGAAPACAYLASSSTSAVPAAGSITLSTVTASSVSGSASLTFTDGSTLSGTFTAPSAPISADVCQLVAGTCTSYTCVP